ncbi:rubrerythrin-like domain-containing protein [Halopenitus salinus]
MYECFECMGRTTDPDVRICPDCGGELRHIGRPRDV